MQHQVHLHWQLRSCSSPPALELLPAVVSPPLHWPTAADAQHLKTEQPQPPDQMQRANEQRPAAGRAAIEAADAAPCWSRQTAPTEHQTPHPTNEDEQQRLEQRQQQ